MNITEERKRLLKKLDKLDDFLGSKAAEKLTDEQYRLLRVLYFQMCAAEGTMKLYAETENA